MNESGHTYPATALCGPPFKTHSYEQDGALTCVELWMKHRQRCTCGASDASAGVLPPDSGALILGELLIGMSSISSEAAACTKGQCGFTRQCSYKGVSSGSHVCSARLQQKHTTLSVCIASGQ